MSNPTRYTDPSGCSTFSLGWDISGAFGLRIGVSGQVVIDDDGNMGLMVSGVLGGGMPAAGALKTGTYTNADTIWDLNGVGFAVGGSFGVGVDAVFGEARDGSPVYGVQVSGLGPSTPFPEGHGELTKTVVIPLDWLPTYVKKEIYNYANDFWTTNRDYISVIERVDAR